MDFSSASIAKRFFYAKKYIIIQDGEKGLNSYTIAIAKKCFFSIDPAKLKKCIKVDTVPLNPIENDMYYNTIDNNYYIAIS